jgi:hypothetical protein
MNSKQNTQPVALLLNHNPQYADGLPVWEFFPILGGEYWTGSDGIKVVEAQWSLEQAVDKALRLTV